MTIGNSERTEPLTLVGPKGIERIVNGLRVIAPELPYKIRFIELTEPYETFEIKGYHMEAFRLNHKVMCYGYNINIPRTGKFNVERAKALNLPVKSWSLLQKGETVEMDGQVYTPDMVLGEDRKGLKVTYCTDTRPLPAIVTHAKEADLFVCEGMYGDKTENTNAIIYKHMTFEEAAVLAKKAKVKELWLTHFSPSLVRPKEYQHMAKKIFKKTKIGKDRMTKVFKFED